MLQDPGLLNYSSSTRGWAHPGEGGSGICSQEVDYPCDPEN